MPMIDTVQKWIAPAITVFVLGSGLIVNYTIVRGEQAQQGKELAEIKSDAKSDRKSIQEMDKNLALLKQDMGGLKENLNEQKQAIQKQQETLNAILAELRKP